MLMNYLLFLMVFLIQLLVKLNEKLLYQMGKYIQLQQCHISRNLEMRRLLRISSGKRLEMGKVVPVLPGPRSNFVFDRDRHQNFFLKGIGTET
jgi:hypothetical protein